MSSNQNQNQQVSGPSVITSPNADTRTFNHRGTEVGSSNVTRYNNTTNSNTKLLEWTIPKKYEQVVFAGGKHVTKAELRTEETFTGTAGTDNPISLNTDIVPIAGYETISDQPFPVCVAYDTTAGTEYSVDSADYENDTVTLGTDPPDGNSIKLWPVISRGTIQYRGIDAFSHQVGPLDEWGVGAHVFADFNQEKNTTQVHMVGAARFDRDEKLAMYIDAPQQVQWTDTDYPNGQYVSMVEQRVDVEI